MTVTDFEREKDCEKREESLDGSHEEAGEARTGDRTWGARRHGWR